MNIQAPAVHSAREATKRALEMKSFMQEKILAGQAQAQMNKEKREMKMEEDKKLREEKMAKEQKIAQKVAKEKKEKETNELASLLK